MAAKALKKILGIQHRYAQLRHGLSYVAPEESHCYNATDRVLLTFDDYGDADTISGILAVLKREQVKAFFFLEGEWADQNQDLVEKIRQAGHWIGNHTYSHPHLLDLTEDEVEDEISRGLRTEIMRPPYGEFNDKVRDIAARHGFKIGVWTVDSLDWKGLSVEEIYENVLPNLHPGACILLHLHPPHTLAALPGLIAGIRERGYELCHDGTEIQV